MKVLIICENQKKDSLSSLIEKFPQFDHLQSLNEATPYLKKLSEYHYLFISEGLVNSDQIHQIENQMQKIPPILFIKDSNKKGSLPQDFIVNRTRRTLSLKGKETHLTPTEFSILDILSFHYPLPVSKTNLKVEIWGENYKNGKMLDVHICHFRKKIKNMGMEIVFDTIHCTYKLVI